MRSPPSNSRSSRTSSSAPVLMPLAAEPAAGSPLLLLGAPVDLALHEFDIRNLGKDHLALLPGALDRKRPAAQQSLDERVVERDVVDPRERDVAAAAAEDAGTDDDPLRCE